MSFRAKLVLINWSPLIEVCEPFWRIVHELCSGTSSNSKDAACSLRFALGEEFWRSAESWITSRQLARVGTCVDVVRFCAGGELYERLNSRKKYTEEYAATTAEHSESLHTILGMKRAPPVPPTPLCTWEDGPISHTWWVAKHDMIKYDVFPRTSLQLGLASYQDIESDSKLSASVLGGATARSVLSQCPASARSVPDQCDTEQATECSRMSPFGLTFRGKFNSKTRPPLKPFGRDHG